MMVPSPLRFALTLLLVIPFPVTAQSLGLWTSPAELARIPASGCAWEEVLDAADAADPAEATIAEQDRNNNVEILAAAIVWARTGTQSYRTKVTTAIDNLVATGNPGDRTLAWARETGAYALAADLVGYRTPAFETWLRNVAEVWLDENDYTLLAMFKRRPNNWGAHGFGSLTAIYAYLEDDVRLAEVRDHWIQTVIGPAPESVSYGDDLSWQLDPANPRWINPKGAVKQGLVIDGIVPDDMRRNGSFANPPPNTTSYHWGALQGQVMAARILERQGLSIWDVSDQALKRAIEVLQVTWEDAFGGWKAEGDDEWMLPFIDEAYDTTWSSAYDTCTDRIWRHGKNTGWGWITLDAIIFADDFESDSTAAWSQARP